MNDLDRYNPKSLQTYSGIDTLYYFVKVNYVDYTIFYTEFVLKDKLEEADFKKVSKDNDAQFIWYRKFIKLFNNYVPLFRIGFKNLNTQDGLLSLYIQLESATIHYFGLENVTNMVREHINIYGFNILKEQVSRADLNIFSSGYDFSIISYLDFKTSAKTVRKVAGSIEHNEYIYAGKLETLYLGKSKGTGVQLKIYNKGAELKSTNDYFKESVLMSLFSAKYGKSYGNDFWNIEFSLKRESLKSYKIDTIQDLFLNANSLFIKLMDRYVYLEESKTSNLNSSRLKPHYVWSYLKNSYSLNREPIQDISKIKIKQYFHDDIWLKNRVIEYINENHNKNIDDVILLIKSIKL